MENETETEAQQLRGLLFKQMERLSDPALDLEKELKKADALAKVGTVIVNSHKQQVDYLKILNGNSKNPKSKQIGNGKP